MCIRFYWEVLHKLERPKWVSLVLLCSLWIVVLIGMLLDKNVFVPAKKCVRLNYLLYREDKKEYLKLKPLIRINYLKLAPSKEDVHVMWIYLVNETYEAIIIINIFILIFDHLAYYCECHQCYYYYCHYLVIHSGPYVFRAYSPPQRWDSNKWFLFDFVFITSSTIRYSHGRTTHKLLRPSKHLDLENSIGPSSPS